MKILQVNSVIDIGSTGRIARDLYDYLEDKGHECYIAFGRGNATQGYSTIKIGNTLDQLCHGLYSRVTDRHGFGSNIATKKFIQQIDDLKPDIILLHNIHGYYINIRVLFEYLSELNIPVIWLLHDQWAVSGHSAYFDLKPDGLFPKQLSSRNELKNYPKAIGISQFEKNVKDKKKLFTSINNMTVITPSNWLTIMMKDSFLNEYPLKTIHNGVDTTIFRVDDSNVEALKKVWGAENKVIILGVASVWDERKGLKDFVELAKRLSFDNFQIVLVGVDDDTQSELSDDIICIDKTNSVDELRDIYNAVDVFVNPTYFDNFPTVNIEALACGTPVITYDTGGSPESIDDNTGSVVSQGDTEGLIREIKRWNKKDSTKINYCRMRAKKLFSKEVAYSKYNDLFKTLYENYNVEI